MIYLNGKLVPSEMATISLMDRGLLLGDGIFDTMRAYQGKLPFINFHWQRILASANILKIPLPLSFEAFQRAALLVLESNRLLATDASLRFTLTRGSGPRGLKPPEKMTPSYFFTTAPITIPTPKHIKLITSTIKKNAASPIASIKSLNYLEHVLARMEATAKQADDALLLNTAGNVAEATASNVFMVKQGQVITPPISDGILPGITRQQVMTICQMLGLNIQEQSISLDLLYQADEVFLTNSLNQLQRVGSIDSRVYSSSATYTNKIHDCYLNTL